MMVHLCSNDGVGGGEAGPDDEYGVGVRGQPAHLHCSFNVPVHHPLFSSLVTGRLFVFSMNKVHFQLNYSAYPITFKYFCRFVYDDTIALKVR